MTFPVNVTLTYYFETLLLSRDANSRRRCYVNKRWRRGEWPFL